MPNTLADYSHLIESGQSPYYEIWEFIVDKLRRDYEKSGGGLRALTVRINPRTVQEEIKKETGSEKITPVNIFRSMHAGLIGSGLVEGEDFYHSHAKRGKSNYRIVLNEKTVLELGRLLRNA